jgi:predicted NBD/HSP70 family sugar kinase
MSADGEILRRESVPTDYRSKEDYLNNLQQIALKYKELGDEIAISTNGRMCPDGNTYRAYTMKFLQDVNLKNEIELRTGLPVTVLNDGFSAALGEWWKGAGQGFRNLLVIVLGSGMGGGLIIDGKLYQGSKRNAAMVFGMLGPYGEGKCELSSLSTSFTVLLYQMAEIKQVSIEQMTGQRFFEYIEEEDPSALGLLELYCESIAGVIYNSAILLDVDCTVVTGGLTSRKLLMDTLHRKLKEIPEKALTGQTKVLLDMAAGDLSDFNIPLKNGLLHTDANLYGALYHLLHKE